MSAVAPPLVYITGASSGIGQALAEAYAERGWRLALVARRGERLQPGRMPAASGRTGCWC